MFVEAVQHTDTPFNSLSLLNQRTYNSIHPPSILHSLPAFLLTYLIVRTTLSPSFPPFLSLSFLHLSVHPSLHFSLFHSCISQSILPSISLFHSCISQSVLPSISLSFIPASLLAYLIVYIYNCTRGVARCRAACASLYQGMPGPHAGYSC